MNKFLCCLISLFCSLFFYTLKVNGADVKEISPETAVNIALKKNIDILNAGIDYEIAKNNIEIASSLQNPHLVSDLFLGRIAKGNSNQIGILMPVEIAKRKIRKNIVIDEAQIKYFQLRKKIYQIKKDVYLSYILLMLYKEKFILEEKYLAFLIHKKFNDNEYKKLLILKQQNYLKDIISEIGLKRQQFNDLIQSDANTIYDVIDYDIYNFKFDEKILTDYLYEIVEINKNILEKEENAALKNIQLTKNKRIPDILVGGGIAYEYGEKTYDHDNVGGFISLDFEVPVLNFYNAEIKNAVLSYEQVKMKKIQSEKEMRQYIHSKEKEFSILKNNYISARKNFESFHLSKNKEAVFTVKKDYIKSFEELIIFFCNLKE